MKYFKRNVANRSHFHNTCQIIIIIIMIIGIYIAPFPFIKCSKALHIVIV